MTVRYEKEGDGVRVVAGSLTPATPLPPLLGRWESTWDQRGARRGGHGGARGRRDARRD